jgi:hypothetical protein
VTYHFFFLPKASRDDDLIYTTSVHLAQMLEFESEIPPFASNNRVMLKTKEPTALHEIYTTVGGMELARFTTKFRV